MYHAGNDLTYLTFSEKENHKNSKVLAWQGIYDSSKEGYFFDPPHQTTVVTRMTLHFQLGNPCEPFLCHCDSGRGDNPINTPLKMNGRNLKNHPIEIQKII